MSRRPPAACLFCFYFLSYRYGRVLNGLLTLALGGLLRGAWVLTRRLQAVLTRRHSGAAGDMAARRRTAAEIMVRGSNVRQ